MRASSNRNQTPKPGDKHTRSSNSSAQKHRCSVITTMINKLKKNKLLAKSYKAFMCHYVELNILLASVNEHQLKQMVNVTLHLQFPESLIINTKPFILSAFLCLIFS